MANFLDAQQRHKENPLSFQVPNEKQLDEIKSGDYVKICENNERFWVELSKINQDKMVGRIDNDLVLPHPFKCDDVISFEKKNIMAIY